MHVHVHVYHDSGILFVTYNAETCTDNHVKYVHVHVYMYVCMYMYVHIYMYMYMYIFIYNLFTMFTLLRNAS